MNTEIAEKVKEFESRRNSLLNELAGFDPGVLAAAPGETGWSVIEIVEHLVVAEREVLMGLPEPAEMKRYDRTFKNKLMLKVVMLVLGRIRVKVPSRTMIPKGGGDLSDLRSRWDESQDWLRRYIEECDPAQLNEAVFKHPVAGPINAPQVVEMGIAHLDAHTKQIRKVLKCVAGEA